ncbi:hypothetical protein GJ744_004355 [Endocarpon pusillum]|uniref:UBA domain-containing protein n=1 Tax=Endocarpon pusillum TaxID=364733 RepID=A0A8H7A5R5_9EURO|nr:hypothetical protein GJ744_004355 [Endocarpon pusillum]
MDADGMTTLLDVLQLSPGDAQFLLQKYNNDASRAIQEYCENPDVLKQTQPTRGWEEPPPYHNADMPGFRIDASDDVANSVREAAPSRPPTRASYRDEPIDLTPQHRAADPTKSLSYQENDREEREMQEAIALSMAQPPPGQENGVTGTGQQFGPAKGEYSDTKRWAMTVSKAREIVDNPPPADRQRKPGEPAFLRASDRDGSESLAALLTIYHSIPLAREALLLPSYQQFNYGCDPQWWTGRRIEAPRIVSINDRAAHRNCDDVLIETQRLMAFLDDTHRTYASIDALVDLQSYYAKEAESQLSRFLEAWNDGAVIRSRDDPLTQIFSYHGIRGDPGNVLERYFFTLEPMVDPEVDQSFTEIIDNIIWSDQVSFDGHLNDVWIDKIGEIMTLKLSDPQRKQGKLGIEIPTVWYPDRYMQHFRDASRDMRVRRWHIQKQILKLERSKENLLTCPPSARPGRLDIRKVLSDAAERAPLMIKTQPQQGIMSGTMSSPVPSSAEVSDCVKSLRDLVSSIETKLAELELMREELRACFRAMTAELTSPKDEPSLSPTHKYTLRGVSTKPHITYVLRPIAEASQQSEADCSVSGQWQWWRIALSSEEAKSENSAAYGAQPQSVPLSEQQNSINSSGPFSPWPPSNTQNNRLLSENTGSVVAYTIQKVGEEDVLKAAREEHDSVTLVYASEKAVNFRGSALSGPLQTFVKADNKMFDNELRGITQSQGPEGISNGEEMTQLHFSNLDGMQDVPLIDDSDETLNGERETSTPATVGWSARREADGQPSPKRAKGDDEPPPYHDNGRNAPEMQERGGGMGILGTAPPNRIGQHAEKMMERVEDDTDADGRGTAHLERSAS